MKRILLIILLAISVCGCVGADVYPPQIGVSVEGSNPIAITHLPIINNRSGEGPRPVHLPYIAKPGYQGQKSAVRWLGVANMPGEEMPISIPVSWQLIDPSTGVRLDGKTYHQALDMQKVLATPMGKQLKQGKELLIELVFNGSKFRARLSTRSTLDPIWIN